MKRKIITRKVRKIVCIVLGIVLLITLFAIAAEIAHMKKTPSKNTDHSHKVLGIKSDSENVPDKSDKPQDTNVAENNSGSIDYNDAQQLALAYIGKTTDELLGQIGEPLSKSYTPNDEGYGEYGIWYYEKFVVYTYKNIQGEEIVENVS